MSNHRGWDELAVGYAMRALEPEDEQQFEAHLAGCRLCQDNMVDYDAVLGQVALAAEPAAPPPAVLDAIRAGMAQSGQHHGQSANPGPAPDEQRATEHPAAWRIASHAWSDRRGGRGRAPGPRDPRSPSTWRVGVLVAASLAAVIGLAGWNVVLRSDNSMQADVAARRGAIIAAIDQPGARTITLTSRATGHTQALAVVRDQHLWLVVDGLPSIGSDRDVYVLWARARSGGATAMKAFDAGGTLQLVDAGTMPSPLPALSGFAITREDRGPLPPYPTRPPEAAGSVASA